MLNAQVQAPIAVVNDTIDTCGAVTWLDGHTYTSNSSGYVVLKDVSDNDSVLLVMTFIIRKASGSEVWDSTCGNYRWAQTGKVYTAPGDYYDTLVNAEGCDSIITLHLSQKTPDTTYTDITQCAAYTWTVTGDTYTNDTTVYAANPTIGPDSCQGVLALRFQRVTAADTMTVSTCESSYTWPINGQPYSGKGIITYRKTNSGAGCDTLFTLNYNTGMGEFELPDTNVEAIGFYVWGNDTIKAQGAIVDTVLEQRFASTSSCDTVKNFNVRILPVYRIDTAFCGRASGRNYRGFRWPGVTASQMKIWLVTTGDTTYLLKGSNQQDSCLMEFHFTDLASDTTWLPAVTACDHYTWDASGATYRQSRDTIVCRLTNVGGCDSIVIIPKLTINALPNIYIGGTLWIRPGASTRLFAVGDSNLTYQWSTGETTDTITVSPSQNTEYTLVATNDKSCSRTATATVVVNEGINQANAASVKIYPNPAATKVTIEGENLANIKLYNMLGQLMVSQNATSGKVVINVNDYNNGSYILRAESNDGKTTIRSLVIKK